MLMPHMSMMQLEQLAGEHSTRPASDVKAHWRDIVQEANALGEVIVTSYNRPVVVVVSVEHFAELKTQALASDPLRQLRGEFDRELATLREAGAAEKLQAASASTPEEIANAANAAPSQREE
jgi:prevent-host-death family protein